MFYSPSKLVAKILIDAENGSREMKYIKSLILYVFTG